MAEPPAHTFTWAISGSYATWTLAITAAPPGEPGAGPLPCFPEAAFANLTRYFADAVNLYEVARDYDEARAFNYRRES